MTCEKFTVRINGTCYDGGYNKEIIKSSSFVEHIIREIPSMIVMKEDSYIKAGHIESGKAGPFSLFVKRMKYKNTLDKFRNFIRGTPAKREFKKNALFLDACIFVPVPVVFADSGTESVFISRYYNACDAGKLYKLYKDDFCKSGNSFAGAIARFHLTGAVHGDLKWSNLLIPHEERTDKLKNCSVEEQYTCIFTDIKQSRIYKKINLYGIEHDLRRFCRFAFEIGAENWVRNEFYHVYNENMPGILKIDFKKVENKAYCDWEKKDFRKF